MPTPALKITHLRKVYRRGNVAVDDLSLTIAEGDFFGFLGPNGAGKSTTIHCVTGIATPTGGTIEIFGLLSGELHIHGGFWDFMANFNINKAGFAIAGLFLAVWAIAIGYWRFANVETRWATQPAAPRQPSADGPHPASGTPAAGPAGTSTP